MSNLFEMDLNLYSLLVSDVFMMEFTFDEWPNTHTNNDKVLKPYNGQLFKLMHRYLDVFPDIEYAPMDSRIGELKLNYQDSSSYPIEKKKKAKMNKIKYKLNLLPQIGIHITRQNGRRVYHNENTSFTALCRSTSELDVFLAESVQDVIDFKWELIGRNWHIIGCLFHIYYIIVIAIYIDIVYNKNLTTSENRTGY